MGVVSSPPNNPCTLTPGLEEGKIQCFGLSRGLSPAECDKRFLDLACRIDRYGMDFHKVLVSCDTTHHALCPD